MQKTTLRQNITSEDRKWFIIDADGKTLGKVATEAARRLTGKYRADYTPHSNCGEYVIITNVEKVAVSGKKEDRKMYFRHSGYLGNLKSQSLAEVREKQPQRILESAISGMIPNNRLRKPIMRRLRLIEGPENTYAAQKPEVITID